MRMQVVCALLIVCLAPALALTACGGIGASSQSGVSNAGAPFRVTDCSAAAVAQGAAVRHQRQMSPAASVYTSAVLGSVYALSADDGAQQWCVHFKLVRYNYNCPPGAHCPPAPTAMIGQPLFADGMVYVCVSGADNGVTYALDAVDGAQRWSQATGCASSDTPFDDDAQPILAADLLYTGSLGLDPADGSVRWRLPAALTQATICAVADGLVYVYGADQPYGDAVAAVRQTTATVAWTTALTAPVGGRPAINNGILYVGDINSGSQSVSSTLPDTYALDARTGAIRWQSPTGPVGGASVVAANGLVYISANTLDALNPATGAIRWRTTGASGEQSSLLVAGSRAYFVGDGVYAADANTGVVRWHNALGDGQSLTFMGPLLLGGAIYAVGEDGSGHSILFALDAASGALRWQRAGFDQLTAPTA